MIVREIARSSACVGGTSLNALCPRDRELVSEVFRTNGQRKVWSPAHAAAIEHYSKFFGHLLEDVSEKDLIAMRLQVVRECGKPLNELAGVA